MIASLTEENKDGKQQSHVSILYFCAHTTALLLGEMGTNIVDDSVRSLYDLVLWSFPSNNRQALTLIQPLFIFISQLHIHTVIT